MSAYLISLIFLITLLCTACGGGGTSETGENNESTATSGTSNTASAAATVTQTDDKNTAGSSISTTTFVPKISIVSGQTFKENDSAQTLNVQCQWDVQPNADFTVYYGVTDVNSGRVSRANGFVTIAQDEPCQLPVTIVGDLRINRANRFQMWLTSASGATVKLAVVAVELDDDDAYGVNGQNDTQMSFSRLNNDGYIVPSGQVCAKDTTTGKVWLNLDATTGPQVRSTHLWTFTKDSNDCGGITATCRAQSLVDLLNEQKVCGQSQWRIPSIAELIGVAAYDRRPAMAQKISNFGPPTQRYFGSADLFPIPLSGGNHRWILSDSGEQLRTDESRNDGFALIPVSGPAAVANSCAGANERFSLSVAGTLVDQNTNLMWQRCYAGLTYSGNADADPSNDQCHGTVRIFNREEALTYASNFSGNGFSDWRLPTLKEAATLSQPQCYNPAMNASVIPGFGGTPSNGPNYLGNAKSIWTDSVLNNSNSNIYARYSFESGYFWLNNASTPHSVLLVRNYIQ